MRWEFSESFEKEVVPESAILNNFEHVVAMFDAHFSWYMLGGVRWRRSVHICYTKLFVPSLCRLVFVDM